MSLDAVLKVGGSLSRGETLAPLLELVARLGTRYGLVVVPGGGDFADTVRLHYRRYALGETAAHCMALLAMDQYGYLLAELLPGSVRVQGLAQAREAVAEGRVAILLPSMLLIDADPLPHSWDVTSDSLAAWIAGLAAAHRCVLLKDVDGLYEPADGANEAAIQPELTVAALARRRGGVDEHLPVVLARSSIETWVINGQHPERLAELLTTGKTLGTRILRHDAAEALPEWCQS